MSKIVWTNPHNGREYVVDMGDTRPEYEKPWNGVNRDNYSIGAAEGGSKRYFYLSISKVSGGSFVDKEQEHKGTFLYINLDELVRLRNDIDKVMS